MNSLLLLALVFDLAGAPSGPPTPEEERLFADGLRAFDVGDARTAETLWKQGYALRADPAFLVRIGEAQEKTGAARAATESYRRYLREAPDAADRSEMERRIARLAAAAPAPPAAESATTTPLAAAPPTRPGPAIDTEDTPASLRRPGAPEPSGWNAYNTTAWIAIAATVALLGTAGFFAASAGSKSADIDLLIKFHNPGRGPPLEYQAVAAQYESATADGRHDDRVAKALLLAAAGTAVVATTFSIINGASEVPAGVGIAPAAGDGVGLTLFGSWRWRF